MVRCEFCNLSVDDGAYIELKGTRYWKGSTCGCGAKPDEELCEIIYFKGIAKDKLLNLKDVYGELSGNEFTQDCDRERLIKMISVIDMVLTTK